jgi:hypothetical protein
MNKIVLMQDRAEEIVEILRLGLEFLRTMNPEDKASEIHLNGRVRRTENIIYEIERDIKNNVLVSASEKMCKNAERLREGEDSFSISKTNWIEGKR